MQIVWFKRDLRVHDHEALARAAQAGPVIPLYIVEPALWSQPDCSRRQWDFLRDNLVDLRRTLAGIGQPLVVRTGEAREVLRDLIVRYRVEAVWSHLETGNDWTYRRDRNVAALLREQRVAWHECRQHGVVRGRCERDHWSRQWESLMRAPQFGVPSLPAVDAIEPGEIPSRPETLSSGEDCPGRQGGGRPMAEQVLQSFLMNRGEHYHHEMSSPLSASQACSRLSAHLALGTLSMREVVQATRARRSQVADRTAAPLNDWRRALAAFEGRLHWHCHFIQKLESEPRVEFEDLHAATRGLRPAEADSAKFEAWSGGQTGWPLVDACTRFLDHHGWLNFRMRAMLMAVASYQLWLPWRTTGLHLARQFVDYEPGIHWSQVQMQSGTTGINALRIYNPIKQSRDQDPQGRFIRTWIPELTHVGDDWIHTPWQMPLAVQRRAGMLIDRDYPAPLVDHEQAARLARERILEARRSRGARQQSRRIYQRHGSRRRGARKAQRDLFGDGP